LLDDHGRYDQHCGSHHRVKSTAAFWSASEVNLPFRRLDDGAVPQDEIANAIALYVFHAVLRKVAPRGDAEWSVAKRRVPPRATAQTALSSETEPIRREQPALASAPICLVSTCSGLVPRRSGRDHTPSGEIAPMSAGTGTGGGCGKAQFVSVHDQRAPAWRQSTESA